MSEGTTPREPETEAGKRLLNDPDEYDFLDRVPNQDELRKHILAIEAELRAKLAAEVEGLPGLEYGAGPVHYLNSDFVDRTRLLRLLRGDSGGAA